MFSICLYSFLALSSYLIFCHTDLWLTKVIILIFIAFTFSLPFLFLYAYLKSKYDEKYHGAVFDKHSGIKMWFSIISLSLLIINIWARGGNTMIPKLINDVLKGLSL